MQIKFIVIIMYSKLFEHVIMNRKIPKFVAIFFGHQITILNLKCQNKFNHYLIIIYALIVLHHSIKKIWYQCDNKEMNKNIIKIYFLLFYKRSH